TVNAQDAVHAVAAKEGGRIANVVGGDQDLAGLLIVDGQEDQIGAGLLALLHLSGQVGVIVGSKGGSCNNIQAASRSLLGKSGVNAGGVSVGRIVDDADGSAQRIVSNVIGCGKALVGVCKAHLESVALACRNHIHRG